MDYWSTCRRPGLGWLTSAFSISLLFNFILFLLVAFFWRIDWEKRWKFGPYLYTDSSHRINDSRWRPICILRNFIYFHLFPCNRILNQNSHLFSFVFFWFILIIIFEYWKNSFFCWFLLASNFKRSFSFESKKHY